MEWLQGSCYLLIREEWRGFKAAVMIYDFASDKSVFFYYVPGREIFLHNLPVMNLCLLRDGKTLAVDRLTLQGTETQVAPVGLHDGRYVALLATALVDDSGELGPTARKIKELKADGIEHVLVEYGF